MDAYPYSEQEVDLLEALLFDEAGEDAVDLFGLHGLVTALQIFPGKADQEPALLEIVTGDASVFNNEQQRVFKALTAKLATHISEQLDTESGFNLPEEVFTDADALISWTSAFMEGVFTHEEEWFKSSREEQVASLLLPVMTHSGLYDSPEFQGIQENPELMVSLMEQIPEVVIDLYLLMNAEK